MKTLEWLIGVIAGDGRISDRYVRVYNNDESVISNCREVFRKQFGIEEPKLKIRKLTKNRNGFRRKTETTELTINSTELASVFNKLKDQLLMKPTNDFLSGLFEAEGSIDLRGTVTFWQRKDTTGKEISQSVIKWLNRNGIKFVTFKNQDFYILEVLGSYKNYNNLQKFLRHVRFFSEHKIKDTQLILDIFSSHKSIPKKDILKYVKLQSSVTVRDVIEKFHMPKMNAYKTLNKLVKENWIIKTDTYPNNYIYPAGILR